MWKKGTDIALRYGVLLMHLQHYTVFVSVGLVLSFDFVFMQVNPELKNHFEDTGFRFVGQDIEGERMEVIELDGMEAEAFFKVKTFNRMHTFITFQMSVLDHPYFVGVQYHPEFTSRPIKPSPPYLGLLLASAGKLQSYLQKGCRLSPR